jgi:mono/diheme cytochrome c family protein
MRVIMRTIVLVALAALAGLPARADEASPIFSTGTTFAEQTGGTLYAGVCQACHMADAKGAAAAGHYPALAANPKLEAAGYPLTVVLHGLNGMPPVGQMMSDAQVAAVVNYVRTHFGNNYTDAVKPEDVKQLR